MLDPYIREGVELVLLCMERLSAMPYLDEDGCGQCYQAKVLLYPSLCKQEVTLWGIQAAHAMQLPQD